MHLEYTKRRPGAINFEYGSLRRLLRPCLYRWADTVTTTFRRDMYIEFVVSVVPNSKFLIRLYYFTFFQSILCYWWWFVRHTQTKSATTTVRRHANQINVCYSVQSNCSHNIEDDEEILQHFLNIFCILNSINK